MFRIRRSFLLCPYPLATCQVWGQDSLRHSQLHFQLRESGAELNCEAFGGGVDTKTRDVRLTGRTGKWSCRFGNDGLDDSSNDSQANDGQ